MPLPFVLGAVVAKVALGAAVTAGVVGAAKGVKGVMDSKEADDVMERAERILNRAKESIEAQKESTAFALKKLGEAKIEVCSNSMREFLFYFSKIKNITLSDVMDQDELKNLNYNSESLKSMEYVSLNATEIMKSGLGGVAAGTLLAWGSYSAVGALGAASTGVGIAGLSGAAATNATLAWLGGGSLAAGGGGMALGTVVLGGLIAGPALLIAGGIFGAKAEEKLNNAYSNLSEAKVIAENLKVAGTELENIDNITYQILEILFTLKKYLNVGNENLARLVNKSMDWKTYSLEEKQTIMEVLKLAQGIKLIVDTPILNESGVISEEAKNLLKTPEVNEEKKQIEKSEAISKPKFCSECGEKLKEVAKFCSQCGAKIA